MTIEYLDSKRLSGLSTDIKPRNIQANSIFVQTDTGSRLWFPGSHDSMYEYFQALTSVQTSHFVEWFSGSALSSIWTKTQVGGSGGSVVASDEIDGGFELTSGTGANNNYRADFGTKRHYDEQASVVIGVWKLKVNSSVKGGGLGLANAGTGNDSAFIKNIASQTYKTCTSRGTSTTNTDSTVATDANWHVTKMEMKSASIDYYIDGVLEVTNTTNLPTATVQPTFFADDSASVPAITCIRYLEAYNTSVSINSSLYEILSALTQVAGQRVVETFSGSDRQTARWTKTESGTGTAVMANEIDGGFTLYPAASNTNYIQINFNNINQYDEANSVMICVFKQATTNGGATTCQMATTNTSWNLQTYGTRLWASDTYFVLRTADASTVSNTNSSITKDTSFHTWKFEASASDIKLYLDGVLEVTKTTNRPTTPVQPVLMSWNENGNRDYSHFRYLEAYNKLAIPGWYNSVYEMFNPLTTVAKAHFWEWFEGNNIDTTRWTTTGIGTATTKDEINGGVEIASSNTATSVAFNNRQYDNSNSVFISVFKRNTSGQGITHVGLVDTANTLGGNFSIAEDATNQTYKRLQTRDNSTTSSTNSTIAVDLAYHVYKVDLGASDNKLYIDGVLEVTKTTNLPTGKLMPELGTDRSAVGVANGMQSTYFEAYNT